MCASGCPLAPPSHPVRPCLRPFVHLRPSRPSVARAGSGCTFCGWRSTRAFPRSAADASASDRPSLRGCPSGAPRGARAPPRIRRDPGAGGAPGPQNARPPSEGDRCHPPGHLAPQPPVANIEARTCSGTVPVEATRGRRRTARAPRGPGGGEGRNHREGRRPLQGRRGMRHRSKRVDRGRGTTSRVCGFFSPPR